MDRSELLEQLRDRVDAVENRNDLQIALVRDDRIRADFFGRDFSQVTYKDANGRNAFHYAAQFNRVWALKHLLDHHSETFIIDGEGQTPLSIAARSGMVESVFVILNHSAFTNSGYFWLNFGNDIGQAMREVERRKNSYIDQPANDELIVRLETCKILLADFIRAKST